MLGACFGQSSVFLWLCGVGTIRRYRHSENVCWEQSAEHTLWCWCWATPGPRCRDRAAPGAAGRWDLSRWVSGALPGQLPVCTASEAASGPRQRRHPCALRTPLKGHLETGK